MPWNSRLIRFFTQEQNILNFTITSFEKRLKKVRTIGIIDWKENLVKAHTFFIWGKRSKGKKRLCLLSDSCSLQIAYLIGLDLQSRKSALIRLDFSSDLSEVIHKSRNVLSFNELIINWMPSRHSHSQKLYTCKEFHSWLGEQAKDGLNRVIQLKPPIAER